MYELFNWGRLCVFVEAFKNRASNVQDIWLRFIVFCCGVASILSIIFFTTLHFIEPEEQPMRYVDYSWNLSKISNTKGLISQEQASIKAYFHEHQMLRQVVSNDISGRVFFQRNWEPSYTCTVATRFGSPGDGGKWICDPHRALTQNNCVVYSIGSNDEFSFEESIHHFNPKCEIHTFDPTTPHPKNCPPFVSFHPWALGQFDSPFSYTIPTIMRRLGHNSVSVLKVDCEGCELDTFIWPSFHVKKGVIQQILVEIHFDKNPERVHAMLGFLSTKGYAIFNKEANIQYSNGNAVEFALVHLDWMKFK